MALANFIVKPVIIAAGAFFAVTGITGIVNANKLYPNTYFNGVKVGGRSVDDLTTEINLDKEIEVKTENDSEFINLNDIGYAAEYITDLQKIKNEQPSFLYIFAGTKNYDVDIDVNYDKEKLKEKVNSLKCVNSQNKPKDAYIAFKDNHFEIVEEVEGDSYNSENIYKTISNTLDKGIILNNIPIDISSAKDKPNVTSDNNVLNDNLQKLNAIANNTITLDLEGATEELKEVGKYISYENNKPVINKEKITEYLNTLSEKYNTLETKRKFQTTEKGEIEVGGSGIDTYGFKLNVEDSVPIMEDAILNNLKEPVKLSWEYPANTRNGKNGDIEDTYVEIDISRQHMWFYVNGELFVDTDVRTGTESSAQWTPTTEGVFRILWKQRDKWFTQVQPVCHSDYWMPFNYRGEGIHDATWYSTYGGNYYKWSGSHGCINTPYDKVKEIYEKIEEDTPVIVYRS